jgi:hypothetical protein
MITVGIIACFVVLSLICGLVTLVCFDSSDINLSPWQLRVVFATGLLWIPIGLVYACTYLVKVLVTDLYKTLKT